MDILIFVLFHVLWTPRISALMSLILIKILGHYYFKYLFCLSFPNIPTCICYTFCNCSHSPWIFCFIFLNVFYLNFSFESICWHIFKLTDVSLAMSNLQMSSLNALLISPTLFFILSISFCLLGFPSFAYITHLFWHVVHFFFFSLEPLGY